MNAETKFGSIEDYVKGGVEIIGRDDPARYLFSNMFEVAGNAQPWERTVVAKNLEFTIEVTRAEGASPWYACAHDETALLVQGAMEVHFVKPSDASMLPPEDKEGAVRLSTTPAGTKIGHIVASRGHLTLLPAGAAYQFRMQNLGVILIQSIFGDESIEKWADICQH